jgi:ketosteroid isomerase-like protein
MTPNQVRKSIASGNREFSAAAARKDYAAIAALHTEAAMVLPPDAPVVRGRKAIEEFWRAAVSSLDLVGVTLQTLDLEFQGDAAFEVGEAELKSSSGLARVKYLVVWMRGNDGQWRLHRDIWNGAQA